MFPFTAPTTTKRSLAPPPLLSFWQASHVVVEQGRLAVAAARGGGSGSSRRLRPVRGSVPRPSPGIMRHTKRCPKRKLACLPASCCLHRARAVDRFAWRGCIWPAALCRLASIFSMKRCWCGIHVAGRSPSCGSRSVSRGSVRSQSRTHANGDGQRERTDCGTAWKTAVHPSPNVL